MRDLSPYERKDSFVTLSDEGEVGGIGAGTRSVRRWICSDIFLSVVISTQTCHPYVHTAILEIILLVSWRCWFSLKVPFVNVNVTSYRSWKTSKCKFMSVDLSKNQVRHTSIYGNRNVVEDYLLLDQPREFSLC